MPPNTSRWVAAGEFLRVSLSISAGNIQKKWVETLPYGIDSITGW
jgi:hypothetical protein